MQYCIVGVNDVALLRLVVLWIQFDDKYLLKIRCMDGVELVSFGDRLLATHQIAIIILSWQAQWERATAL